MCVVHECVRAFLLRFFELCVYINCVTLSVQLCRASAYINALAPSNIIFMLNWAIYCQPIAARIYFILQLHYLVTTCKTKLNICYTIIFKENRFRNAISNLLNSKIDMFRMKQKLFKHI